VASTITGGKGDDVLTASGGAKGAVAQITDVALTDGTNKGLDDNDTMAITVGATTFTYTAAGTVTMDVAATALAAKIDGDAAYKASYAGGKITIEAAVAGTPFTVSGYTVTDVANDVNTKDLTSTVKDNATAAKNEVHTIAIKADDVADGNEVVTVTYDSDGSAGATTATLDIDLTKVDTTKADAVAAAIKAGIEADVAGLGKLATVAVDVSNNVVVTFKDTDAYADTTKITVKADTSGGLAFKETDTANGTLAVSTLAVDNPTPTGGSFTKGDTVSVDVDFDGAGAGGAKTYTYTVAKDAGETVDELMAGLTKAINDDKGAGKVSSATYDSDTNTITVTDAISADLDGVTLSNFKVTDSTEVTNATGTKATITTTTANVTPVGDVLIGGDGADTLKSGAGLGTMTGGAGQDLFVVNAASVNVNAYTTITDFTTEDLIQFASAVAFKSAKVELGATAQFTDYANAAINALAANEVGWFQFNNGTSTDTYLVMDKGDSTAFINGTDFIVKLTGTIDLSNASFNNTHDTIAL